MAAKSELLIDRLDQMAAFRRIARIRQFEQRCLELSNKGLVAGSIHLCLGQEAIPVGAMSALHPRDRVLATYRGHGWALECGVPIVGLLAEICHRAGGINGGRAGSAYAVSPEHGFLGENSIVGAGVPIAAGVALAFERRKEDRIALVSIGDGAMNQGSVHEALNFAAVNRLPLVLVCENNGWSEMTPTSSMVAIDDLASRASAYGIPGRVVDGCDPIAVYQAVDRAAAEARSGGGPTLLECKTVRLSGHYNADVEHYRSKADRDEALELEPLDRLRRTLVDSGLATPDALAEIEAELAAEINRATDIVLAMPPPDPATSRDHVFDNNSVQFSMRPVVQSRLPSEDVVDMTYQRAVNSAMRIELTERPEVIIFGEDVGFSGGIFGVTRKLQKDFGIERVFDTPISESAILGSALGLALMGMRPIVEIMWADFILVALDQLVNQAANTRYISSSMLQAPMVVRMQQGATPGSCAQHSQSLEAFMSHVPGLKVGLPATPGDAYSMLRAATADNDPCVLIEARELYQTTGPVDQSLPVETVGGARMHRTGAAMVIVTWGSMLHRAIAAADRLRDMDVAEIAVLDLRWLRPLDEQAIVEAVAAAGGRVLIAHEANLTGGFGAEVMSRIHERLSSDLDVRAFRLATPDVRIPASPDLQKVLIPGTDAIESMCRRMLRS